MNKEQLLQIWFEKKPSAKSPYTLYGNPPMWETLRDEEDDLVLFSRPGKVQERPAALAPYQEVDGVHYQWQRDGQWVGQGCQSSFEDFARRGPAKIDIPLPVRGPAFSSEFNWGARVSEPALVLPFVEGVPSQAKANAISQWLKKHADKYRKTFVRMYHATDPSIPVEDQGLKPTSATRRRSYQSESGFVYLANTPSRAKNFGDLGNGGNSVVFEVIVPVRDLRADTDQLNNQRHAGNSVGNTIGESVVYGGGARVKGRIEPWAIRRLSAADCAVIEDRNMRMWQMERLGEQLGLGPVFLDCARQGVCRSEHGFYDTDWRSVERDFINQAIVDLEYPADEVREAVMKFSPLAVVASHENVIKRDIANAAAKIAPERASPVTPRRMRPG